jgi:ribosome maturation factor RimP
MASQIITQLEALAGPVLDDLGLRLWDVEYRPTGKRALLRLTVEGAGGDPVTIDQCQVVSREISVLLDVEDPIHTAYDLEVSSPGLDRRLSRGWHFQECSGQRVEVNLYQAIGGHKHLTGILTSADGEHLRIDTDGGTVDLTRDQISKARVVPDYDHLMRNVAG